MINASLESTRIYFRVYISLLALLAATFILSRLHLGHFGLPIALLIASTKAVLVAFYFMNLRRASGIERVVAGVGLFWLGILIIHSLSDYLTRDWLVLPSQWPQ